MDYHERLEEDGRNDQQGGIGHQRLHFGTISVTEPRHTIETRGGIGDQRFDEPTEAAEPEVVALGARGGLE